MIEFALMVLGMVIHFLNQVAKTQGQGFKITPLEYFKTRHLQTILGILGSLAGFFILYGTPELTKFTAFGLGFVADSLAGIAERNATRKLDQFR